MLTLLQKLLNFLFIITYANSFDVLGPSLYFFDYYDIYIVLIFK